MSAAYIPTVAALSVNLPNFQESDEMWYVIPKNPESPAAVH